jgi:hypothetical protein
VTYPRTGFKGLFYEASEREYWASEDDHRWGTRNTTWFGFLMLAFFGRIVLIVKRFLWGSSCR